MAWYRAGGGGIPSAIKTDMNAVLNKKFGTSTDYPPTDWATSVNLLGPLPEKTASGSIAHIEDGADTVPIKSWNVTVDANLDGVSSVKVTQAGKNLLDWSKFTNYSNWKDDIATSETFPTNSYNRGFLLDLPAGNYSITFGISGDSFPTYLYVCKDDGATSTRLIRFSTNTYYANTGTFTVDGTSKYYLRLGNTSSEANFNSQISLISNGQIEIGSATAYEPYAPTVTTVSLGRTIYGGSADVVSGTGTDENGNDFTFDPITPTPETSLGVNNYWADEGDSEVTYRADISLALSALGGRGLSMMRPVNTEEIEFEEEENR